ncbi:MAG: PTS sugar transporter subunit IIA [Planctomycetota bacterium]
MEDLDVAQLATYLHLTPDKVNQLASRGKLPGRKIGGKWRFSEAEIHHWLEERIGASDETELGRYEAVLKRDKPSADVMRLSDLCPVDLIQIPMAARTRGSVFRTMSEIATRTGMMWDAPAMASAVESREAMHPTALESGVALLHPRRPQTSILAESLVSLGVCPSPIPFSDNGQCVDVFFLICSYDDPSHLRILARISRLITATDLLVRLRQADDAAAAALAIADVEEAFDQE